MANLKLKRRPNTTPARRYRGEHINGAGGGWLLLPPKVLALVGQAPAESRVKLLKEDEGYNARTVDRYLRLWFTARGREVPAIMKKVAYWQARKCGWDPRNPKLAVRRPENALSHDGSKVIRRAKYAYISCWPDEGEVWVWWAKLHWTIRASIVYESMKAGVATSHPKRRHRVAGERQASDPTVQPLI